MSPSTAYTSPHEPFFPANNEGGVEGTGRGIVALLEIIGKAVEIIAHELFGELPRS